MSMSFSVQSACRTGVFAVAMPIRLAGRSAGVRTGLPGRDAMTKGFFCIATPMILKGAPWATAAAV